MIINEHKDALQELKKRKAKRAKVPKNYMQKQYAKDLDDLSGEADIITDPVIQRCFVASGIVIKE